MTEPTPAEDEDLRPDMLAKALHEVRDGLSLSAAQTLEQMTDDELGNAVHYVERLSALLGQECLDRVSEEGWPKR